LFYKSWLLCKKGFFYKKTEKNKKQHKSLKLLLTTIKNIKNRTQSNAHALFYTYNFFSFGKTQR
tara:strand:- start:277 stop:468 length:192 start_codon:yes stop_codon:yes gene_type:complete